MIEWFGDALRVKHESPFLDLMDYRAAVTALAGKISTFELLKGLGALQSLLMPFRKTYMKRWLWRPSSWWRSGRSTKKPNGDLAIGRIAR